METKYLMQRSTQQTLINNFEASVLSLLKSLNCYVLKAYSPQKKLQSKSNERFAKGPERKQKWERKGNVQSTENGTKNQMQILAVALTHTHEMTMGSRLVPGGEDGDNSDFTKRPRQLKESVWKLCSLKHYVHVCYPNNFPRLRLVIGIGGFYISPPTLRTSLKLLAVPQDKTSCTEKYNPSKSCTIIH